MHTDNSGTQDADAPRSSGRDPRRLILYAVMLAVFAVGLASTIVTTAMPGIVAELGGFDLIGWVFAAYMLCQALSVPIYGKLADMYGRKPSFYFGTVLFILGSILAGFAGNMMELVLCRALQGLGSGAVYPIASVILADIYTPEQRAKLQGYLSATWGMASVGGPPLGALLVSDWNWSWVFWVNVPFAIAAFAIIRFKFQEQVERHKRRIDYEGGFILMIGATSLIVVLIQGNSMQAHQVAILLGIAIVGLCGFVWQESRAKEPMIPLTLWANRIISVGTIGSFTTGALMMSVMAYMPVYVQAVMGYSPAIAGATMAVMAVGWPLGSSVGGRIMLRSSYRATATIGSVLLVISCLALALIGGDWGIVAIGAFAFVLGTGMGFTTATFIISVQTSVEWNMRGTATGAVTFMRSIGMALGAGAGGAVINMTLSGEEGAGPEIIGTLMEPMQRFSLPVDLAAHLSRVVGSGLENIYLICALLAVMTLVVSARLPAGAKPARRTPKNKGEK